MNEHPQSQSHFAQGNARLVWVWLLLMALATGAVMFVERQRLVGEMNSETTALLRLASQRADQHDAHLTALSAVATSGGAEQSALFLEVAATIRRFYPRIVAIDLVPLAGDEGPVTTRDTISDDIVSAVQQAAKASDGQLMLVATPGEAGSYLLVKRSPNSDAARFGLALEIDAGALIASEREFWSTPLVRQSLQLPQGAELVGAGFKGGPGFSKTLGSASQPLVFQASLAPGWTGVFPVGKILIAVLLMSAGFLGVVLALRQFARTRRAETQASLSAQEARLAHASRVNALGEMASGMAHELTQPLTAILAQVQAGQHLMRRGDTEALAPILTDTVTQARRASAILDRLRHWTRPARSTTHTSSLNEAARGVEALLGPETRRLNTDLTLDLSTGALEVRANQVELEQVIFNLVRNALDALDDAPRRHITIRTRRDGEVGVLEVSDTGPGIRADLRQTLFEPFVTGRTEGTGLGLALCQRLVEQADGDITFETSASGALFRVRLPAVSETVGKTGK